MTKTKIITFSIWLTFCLLILSLPLLSMKNNEAHILYGLIMLGITFPAGYLFAIGIAFIGYTLDQCCGVALPKNETMLVFSWLGFVLVGYLQWFLFMPWAFRKIKKQLNVS